MADLNIDVEAQTGSLSRDLRKARGEVNSFATDASTSLERLNRRGSTSITGLVKRVAGIGAAVTAAATAFGVLVRSQALFVTELQNISVTTGLSIRQVQAYGAALRSLGLEQGELVDIFADTADAIEELRAGTSSFVDAFALIGLAAEDFIGLDTEEAFARIERAVRETGGALGQAFQARLFSSLGANLGQITEKAEEFNRTLRETGGIIEGLGTGNQITTLNDTFTTLTTTIQSQFINGLRDASISGGNWNESIRTLGGGVRSLTTGLVEATVILRDMYAIMTRPRQVFGDFFYRLRRDLEDSGWLRRRTDPVEDERRSLTVRQRSIADSFRDITDTIGDLRDQGADINRVWAFRNFLEEQYTKELQEQQVALAAGIYTQEQVNELREDSQRRYREGIVLLRGETEKLYKALERSARAMQDEEARSIQRALESASRGEATFLELRDPEIAALETLEQKRQDLITLLHTEGRSLDEVAGAIIKLDAAIDNLNTTAGKVVLTINDVEGAARIDNAVRIAEAYDPLLAVTNRYQRQIATLRKAMEVAGAPTELLRKAVADVTDDFTQLRGIIEGLGLDDREERTRFAVLAENFGRFVADEISYSLVDAIRSGDSFGDFAKGVLSRISEALIQSLLGDFIEGLLGSILSSASGNAAGNAGASFGNFLGRIFGGRAHTGGIVPGPSGSERLYLLEAGETVRTRRQESALQTGGGGITINQTLNGDVTRQTRQVMRQYGRELADEVFNQFRQTGALAALQRR